MISRTNIKLKKLREEIKRLEMGKKGKKNKRSRKKKSSRKRLPPRIKTGKNKGRFRKRKKRRLNK